MTEPKTKRPIWLTKNLVTLSWVSLLQDAASEMLYPILPIFLNTVLGAPAAVVGAIEGAAEATAAATKLASRWLNRFMPRKVMVFLGYSGAALGKVIIALAGFWPVVLLGRVVDRLGKGLRSAPRDALLVQGVDAKNRGRVIGFHRSADTLGAVIGPLLALGLLAIFDNDLRPVLWFAVAPGIISAGLVLLVKDNQPRQRAEKPAKVAKVAAAKSTSIVSSLSKLSRLNLAIALIVGFGLVNFSDALVLLHLNQEGFSLQWVIGSYLLFNISYALLSFPAGMLSDRMAPHRVFALGMLAFAIAYGGLALTSDKTWTLVLVVIYGAFAAVNDTVGKSWVSKLAHDDRQLWAQSRLQGLSGFAILISGIWAGLTWNLGSGFGTFPLAISAGLALVFAGVLATRKF